MATAEQIRALEALLPSIIADAAGPAGAQPSAAAAGGQILWGVDLLAESAARACVVGKFLTARDNDVAAAAAMLTNALKWRREFNVDAVMEEVFPDELSSIGFIHGADKEGTPPPPLPHGPKRP
jgi:hypothetical protein